MDGKNTTGASGVAGDGSSENLNTENAEFTSRNPEQGKDSSLTIGSCSDGGPEKCFEYLLSGLAQSDREHVRLEGNKVLVNAEYKSESEAFKMLQSLANTPDAKVQLSILGNDELVEGFTFENGKKINFAELYMQPRLTLGQEWKGQTLFQYRGKPMEDGFSNHNFTEAFVYGSLDELEKIKTVYHELGHAHLWDGGRDIERSRHADPPGFADVYLEQIKQEVERNYLGK